MSRNSRFILSKARPARLLAGALAAAILWPAPAPAFFQTTKLEGAVGTDLGGVWLSMQQIMPEFRITYPKPKAGPAVPVTVGPISADLEKVTGKNPEGVIVTDCGVTTFCNDFGLMVGDIIIKMNVHDITDVASFEKVLGDAPASILLSVRRPALQMTAARVIKIRYENDGKEVQGTTVQEEKLELTVLDLDLPFAERLEKSRQSHKVFEPTAEELEQLKKDWAQIPDNTPSLLIKGGHRFVAKENFDEALAGDKSLAASKFAWVMDMAGNPTRGGGQVIDVYGLESISDSAISGNYVTVTMAAAPFPINIEFKGRFEMIKLAPWSDADDKRRAAENAAKAPKEDLSKFKTLPDVPEAAAPAN